MKSREVIIKEIQYLNSELDMVKDTHDKLDQISMQSLEGSSLRARINKIQGKIEILKWIIQ